MKKRFILMVTLGVSFSPAVLAAEGSRMPARGTGQMTSQDYDSGRPLRCQLAESDLKARRDFGGKRGEAAAAPLSSTTAR